MSRAAFWALLSFACTAAADTLLVVNKHDGNVAFVDPVAMTVRAKVATGEDPHEVAVSRDGRVAVVCNYGSGANPGTSLTIVDVSSMRQVRRFQLPGLLRPHGVQAVGSRFYITAEGSFAIARYNADTNQIDLISGSGQDTTHMLVVVPGEQKIYTANIASNTVTVFELAKLPRDVSIKQVSVGNGPEGIDLAPDGSALWVTAVAKANKPAHLTVIDANNDNILRTIPTTLKLANRLKFSPDGSRVAVSDPGSNEISVFDARTGEVVTRVATAAGPAGVVFSPDGRRLFVSCADAGKVQAVDTVTWTVVGEIETGSEPDGLAYVPK
jgi:YVTN family beta-propeller protein